MSHNILTTVIVTSVIWFLFNYSQYSVVQARFGPHRLQEETLKSQAER